MKEIEIIFVSITYFKIIGHIMPTHIKALIVISIIAFVVFSFAKRTACSLDDCDDFNRRRNLWFAVTATAFLAHNFWIYAIVATIILLLASRREQHKSSIFMLLIFAMPPVGERISGLGVINYLIEVDHTLILSVVILFPAFLLILRDEDQNNHPGRLSNKHAPDYIIIAYILLSLILHLRATTITNVLRDVLYSFAGGYLPYYVISRTLILPYDFRRVFIYFVISVAIMSVIAVFEHGFHWLLYPSLLKALDLHTNLFDWTMRSGVLRAMASTGHSIVLGYLIVIAIGFMLYLKTQFKSRAIAYLVFAVLLAGSYSTLSRGPWVGMVILISVFVLIGPKVISASLKWGLLAVLVISVISASSWGQKFIDLLPYVGTIESENITYREKLLDNALIVIRQNPWFGSINYLETPEMLEMVQGGGIIDVTNTYLGIALRQGLFGLGLFLSFFLLILLGVYRAYQSVPVEETDTRDIGRVLIALIISVLTIIATVSPISFIAIVYWSIGGMGMAYIRMVENKKHSDIDRVEKSNYLRKY